jgi:hypothetical protein
MPHPWPGRQGLVCEFLPGTASVEFGRSGGRIPVLSCGLGFSLVRRDVFEAVAKQGRSRELPSTAQCPRKPARTKRSMRLFESVHSRLDC